MILELKKFLFTQTKALSSHERFFTLFVGSLIGVAGGLASIGFRYLLDVSGGLFRQLPEIAENLLGASWVGIVLAPVVGGAIVGPIIYYFAREAKGHGVPEVMVAIIQKGGFIRPRIAFIKALTSAITISSGGSVGREGPIIQIGSSIGSTLGYLFHVHPRMMRTFVACGAAAGIAATFNAPIAGALFAVEIILGDFGFIQLAPIVTSSVIATVISRSIEGNFAAFHVPPYALMHPFELINYVVLGLVTGVGAVVFIRTLGAMEWVFEEKIKIHDAAKAALGGLLIGLIGLYFPQIFGVGYETIDKALYGELPLLLLAGLVVVKLAATSITLSSGGSGGVFAPSLFLGAMWGGVVGKVAQLIFPGLTASAGAYSLVGMAAMVGAATQAPITAIVIIFELTNDYKIILPLMISTIIAVLTASALNKDSIYTHKLRKLGVDMDQGLEANVLKRVKVEKIMRRKFEKVPQELPFNFLIDMLLQTERSQLPVVDGDKQILGVIPRDLAQKFSLERNILSNLVIARDLISPDLPLVLPEDSLDQLAQKFHENLWREMYVVEDLERRRLIGMVRKGDLSDAFQAEIMKERTGDSFAYNINRAKGVEPLQVMDGYGIIELEAPHDFSGKKLRDLDLRNRYGVNVLAIKRDQVKASMPDKKIWVPESSDTIEDGDILVLLGKTELLNATKGNIFN